MSICQVCSEEFEPKNKYQPSKTCSKECRYRLSSTRNIGAQKKAKRVEGVCLNPHCGERFLYRASKPKKYCSQSCYFEDRRASSTEDRRCEVCEKEITVYSRTNQRFCSPSCRNRSITQGRSKNYPECRVCGESTDSYGRVYCSNHRPRKPGRKPSPRKEAVCLCCGEKFSRPGYWRGAMKYCSNECSHSQRKKVRDKYVANLPDHAVVFHSGWEIRFWSTCLRFGVPIRSYDGPAIETSAGLYRPDFIINGSDVVEVKGRLNPGDEEKIRESGVNVVGKEELFRFEESGEITFRKEGATAGA